MPKRYRVTVSDLVYVPPPVDDDVTVKWESTASTVPEGGTIVRVQVMLSEPVGFPVQVPFVVTGTGTYNTHWRLRQGGSSGSDFWTRPVVQIAAGQTLGSIYVEGLDVDADKTAIFTLAESSDSLGQGTWTLTDGITLAETDQAHTSTIKNDGGAATLEVDFELGSSAVTETDTDFTHNIVATLNRANDYGSNVTVEVTDNGSGTAVAGVDYSTAWTDPVTVTFAPGQIQRTIPITIESTETDTDDETLVLELQNPGAGLVLGSANTTHTVSITDDEDPNPGGKITFPDAGNEVVQENGTIQIPVVYTGGPTHQSTFFITYTVEGTTAGPSGRAAGSGEFRVLSEGILSIPNGSSTAFITIAGQDDQVLTGPRDVKVYLSSITVPVGITWGDHRTKYLTIQDDESEPPGGDGIDGDLTRIDGTRIAPERRGFDHTSPDLICRAVGAVGGSSSSETYEVASDRASAALGVSKGVYPVGIDSTNVAGSAVLEAWRLAETIWTYLHGPSGTLNTYANTAAPAIGTELEEVLIQLNPSEWNPAYTSDQKSNSDPRFAQSSSAKKTGFWDDDKTCEWTGDNTVIRDVIMYSEFTQPATSASVYAFRIGAAGKVDNIRFERIHFVGEKYDNNGSLMGIRGSNKHELLDSTPYPSHGRIKLYDCAYSAHRDAFLPDSGDTYYGGYDPTSGYKHTFLCHSASWDMRYREAGMPWPAWVSGFEHCCYVQSPVGTETYPQLGVDPLDGSYTRASNLWVRMNPSTRQTPYHPAATFNSSTGKWEGPWWSGYRTVFQITNRASHSFTSNMSSGLMAFVDCVATGFGGSPWVVDTQSVGDAFKIHGHNGEVLFRRCGVSPHPATGKTGGGMKFELEGTGASFSGPTDMWWLERESGRYYGTVKATLEGFTAQGGGQGDSVMKFACPPETIDFKQFNITGWDFSEGGVQMRFGSPAEHPGAGFPRFVKVDDLRDEDNENSSYTGSWASYGGWSDTGGTKIEDWYHANWYADSNNYVALNDADVNNFPTEGPAGYTQTNGVIDQEYTNRLQATWGTTGKVSGADGSPTWTSAYDSSGTTPSKPKCEMDSSSTVYIEEGSTTPFIVDIGDTCHTQVRVAFSYSDPGGAVNELQTVNQATWPADPVWSTASSPYTLKPVGGKIGTGDKDDEVDTTYWVPEPKDDYYNANDGAEYVDKVFFRLSTNTGLSAGSKTVTFNLTSASCEFETYPKSTVWEQCDTSGPQSLTIKVIPADDLTEVWPINPEWGFSSANASQLILRSGGTADAQQLAATASYTVNDAETTFDGDFDYTTSHTWSAGVTSAKTHEISNVTGTFTSGAKIVFDISWDAGCQQGNGFGQVIYVVP